MSLVQCFRTLSENCKTKGKSVINPSMNAFAASLAGTADSFAGIGAIEKGNHVSSTFNMDMGQVPKNFLHVLNMVRESSVPFCTIRDDV
ncbi:hypothetical protein RRG08_029981 [Elysia crispata]|uniref:Uncharacterized protein n=1 Tax=Elysia crispata TaxID=231223 RepID=A0AAE0ZJ89_9GAST|nr:hypothetical protein RRG08_029981 [Elysia crispata]